MKFAKSAEAQWRGNFRDLNAAITRMATLASGARINQSEVEAETTRLHLQWQSQSSSTFNLVQLEDYLSLEKIKTIDCLDQAMLRFVLTECQHHTSMASAGRTLFNVSRLEKTSANDSNRIQKLLARYGLSWDQVQT